MATIKTQVVGAQRKIITKINGAQRRISCSCCDGAVECCMYAADALGVFYTAADLPEEVVASWSGQFAGTLTKSGSGYANGQVSLQVVDGQWRLTNSAADPVETLTVGNCLITGDGNFVSGDDLIEDEFADAYSISSDSEDFPFYLNGTMQRISLCEWLKEGDPNIQESAAGVYYFPFTGFIEQPVGWYVFLGEAGTIARKTGDQNTPVGSYTFPSYTVTVSEI